MWNYERHLMYPVQITKPNLDYAKYLVQQLVLMLVNLVQL